MPRAFLLKRNSESENLEGDEVMVAQSMVVDQTIPNILVGDYSDTEDESLAHENFDENGLTYPRIMENLHKQIEKRSKTTDCLRLPPLSGLYLPPQYHLLQQTLFTTNTNSCLTIPSQSVSHSSDDEYSEVIIPSPVGHLSSSSSEYCQTVAISPTSSNEPRDDYHENPLRLLSSLYQNQCVFFPGKNTAETQERFAGKINSPAESSNEREKKFKMHKCEDCSKSFKRASSLSNHRLIHKNTKSFKCEWCNMSFLRKSDLGKHLVIHNGNKPYQCETCGKRFSQSSNMLTHQRRHSGVRPYACSLCGKSFYRKVDVRRHSSVHKG